MKLDQNTIQILKNFSIINPSICFKPGNTLSTISKTSTVLAIANIDQEFTKKFAIYNLSRFLSAMSLFSEPELEITDKNIVISQGKRKTSYTLTEPSLIMSPPEKKISLENPEIDFNITQEHLQEVIKALSVLGLPEIAVVGDGSTISLMAIDSKDPSGDVYSVDVGETSHRFKMYIRAEYLALISSNYNVQISSKGLAKFSSDKITYFIAIESHSKYEG